MEKGQIWLRSKYKVEGMSHMMLFLDINILK